MRMLTVQAEETSLLAGERDSGKVKTYLEFEGFSGIEVSVDPSEGYVTVTDLEKSVDLDKLEKALARYAPIETETEQIRKQILSDEAEAFADMLKMKPETRNSYERAVLAVAVRLGLILTD